MKKSITLIAIITIVSLSLSAQGFQPPTEGKAVVYFARISSYGGGASFEYFLQDKYIGVFKGKNYMRYECNPGEQLFWASTENKEFLTANLKVGGTYIVIVDVIMGFWKAHVGLTPITDTDTELFMRAVDLINSEGPVITPISKIDKMNKKLDKFIDEELEHYYNESKNVRNFKHISEDFAIPADLLK